MRQNHKSSSQGKSTEKWCIRYERNFSPCFHFLLDLRQSKKALVSNTRSVSLRDMEEKWFLVSSHLLDYFWIDGSVYCSEGWDSSWDNFTLKEHNFQSIGIVLSLYGYAGHHFEKCKIDSWKILQIVWYDWITKQRFVENDQ